MKERVYTSTVAITSRRAFELNLQKNVVSGAPLKAKLVPNESTGNFRFDPLCRWAFSSLGLRLPRASVETETPGTRRPLTHPDLDLPASLVTSGQVDWFATRHYWERLGRQQYNRTLGFGLGLQTVVQVLATRYVDVRFCTPDNAAELKDGGLHCLREARCQTGTAASIFRSTVAQRWPMRPFSAFVPCNQSWHLAADSAKSAEE